MANKHIYMGTCSKCHSLEKQIKTTIRWHLTCISMATAKKKKKKKTLEKNKFGEYVE